MARAKMEKREWVREMNNSRDGGLGGRDWQIWHQNGVRCPKGTVPIRRSTVHDVLRAKSLYHFGKKQRAQLPLARHRPDAPDIVSGNGHEVCSHHRHPSAVYQCIPPFI